MKSGTSFVYMPLSTLYRAVTKARMAAYRHGLFSVSKLPAPVISVGNLTVGGSGKTPLVEWVCRVIAAMSQDGDNTKNVCVLTRGYGRENPDTQIVVSDGEEILASEREAGDEPLLLARNLLGIAAVICNPNRMAAGQWAIENLNSERFVLDDGFQHLRLARDLDIVTIDATDPWGGGDLLPSGRLRESASGLSRADCVVVTRTDQAGDPTPLVDAIKRVAGDAPILKSRMSVSGITLVGGQSADALEVRSHPVAAFCAIGNPNSFFNLLRREGYELAMTRAFADHHRYSDAEVEALLAEARSCGAQSLITTAKDATKLSAANFDLPCYVLEIKISIEEDDRLQEMIRSVISRLAQS